MCGRLYCVSSNDINYCLNDYVNVGWSRVFFLFWSLSTYETNFQSFILCLASRPIGINQLTFLRGYFFSISLISPVILPKYTLLDRTQLAVKSSVEEIQSPSLDSFLASGKSLIILRLCCLAQISRYIYPEVDTIERLNSIFPCRDHVLWDTFLVLST